MTTRCARMILPVLAAGTWLAGAIGPVLAQDSPAEPIFQQWDKISQLRRQAQYDEAVAVLDQIIQTYRDSEEVLREAHNQIVLTLYVKPDEQAARERARQGLEAFPDLVAAGIAYPPEINDIYQALRREMFGRLIVSQPEEARVFLSDNYMGTVPVYEQYVRVGTYRLKVTKSGYLDYVEAIVIEPDREWVFEGSLPRHRDAPWYVKRVVVGAVAGVALWSVLANTGGDGGNLEPLPGPPGPPK